MDINLKQKKILFLIPTLRFGGAELFLLRLLEKVCNEYDIVLVVIGAREGLFNEFEELNIRVIYLDYENILAFPVALFSFRRILKNERPEILQSFLYLADILAGVSAYKIGTPLKIWSLRGTNLAAGTRMHKKIIQKLAAFFSNYFPNRIIACSSQVYNFHVERGYPKENMTIIGNFLPNWTIGAKSHSRFLIEEKPVTFSIGLAARYDIGKGHLDLVRCVAAFLKSNKEFQITLRFAGKGCGESGGLMSDIKNLPVTRDLFLTGSLKIEGSGLLSGINLSRWFEELDLYFMSSNSLEGFPNSLAEAVSIGLPAISTPIGSASDFLPNFRLAENSSSEGMLEIFEKFLAESLFERKKVSKDCKNQIISEFTDNKIVESYKSIWRN